MNAEKYFETLETGLLLFKGEDLIFQDDGAPCHRAKRVKDYLASKLIEHMDWSSNSLDLNPIENIWFILKKKVLKKINHNVLELKKNLLEIWGKDIDKAVLNNLCQSKSKRIEECIRKNGGAINY